MITKKNLFSIDSSDSTESEILETLASGKGEFVIERIVSIGHSSPAEFWYDQETTEWVVLLRGNGQIRFEVPDETVSLLPGDWIEIPPHVRHRVEATSSTEETIWLAVHWK